MITVIDQSSADLLASATLHFRGAQSAAHFASLPHSIALVATQGAAITGFCWGYRLDRPDDSTMVYLHELHVDESYRRHGIGRELIEVLIDLAANEGVSKIFLITSADNRPARALYESLGAQIADQGATVNYWWNLDKSG